MLIGGLYYTFGIQKWNYWVKPFWLHHKYGQFAITAITACNGCETKWTFCQAIKSPKELLVLGMLLIYLFFFFFFIRPYRLCHCHSLFLFAATCSFCLRFLPADPSSFATVFQESKGDLVQSQTLCAGFELAAWESLRELLFHWDSKNPQGFLTRKSSLDNSLQ